MKAAMGAGPPLMTTEVLTPARIGDVNAVAASAEMLLKRIGLAALS
jgi:hypothetical protein